MTGGARRRGQVELAEETHEQGSQLLDVLARVTEEVFLAPRLLLVLLVNGRVKAGLEFDKACNVYRPTSSSLWLAWYSWLTRHVARSGDHGCAGAGRPLRAFGRGWESCLGDSCLSSGGL